MRSRFIIITFGLVLLFVIGLLVFVEPIFRLLPGEKSTIMRNRHARLEKIIEDQTLYRSFYDKYQRFYERMTPEQRESLRQIRKKIDSDPQAAALNRELVSYYDWLKTVPHEKASIDEAETIEERLKIISEARENQNDLYHNGSSRSYDGDPDDLKDEPTDADLAKTLEAMDTRQRLKFLSYSPAKFLQEIRSEYTNSQNDTQKR